LLAIISVTRFNASRGAVSGQYVVSHKYVTKFMWDILVQLSSLQVSGHWLLATGSASSQQPVARSLK
jgi:hypothetical protein